jgi:hypothetical protein
MAGPSGAARNRMNERVVGLRACAHAPYGLFVRAVPRRPGVPTSVVIRSRQLPLWRGPAQELSRLGRPSPQRQTPNTGFFLTSRAASLATPDQPHHRYIIGDNDLADVGLVLEVLIRSRQSSCQLRADSGPSTFRRHESSRSDQLQTGHIKHRCQAVCDETVIT